MGTWKDKLAPEEMKKLDELGDERVNGFVAEAIELGEPESVFVCTDSDEDLARVRRMAVEAGEEHALAVEGHTYHFDGPGDQGRDKANTKYLVPEGMSLGRALGSVEREEGLAEIKGYLKGAMRGKTMIVRFLCLAPTGSEFAIPAVQVTDSWYVSHSESLLYRAGYEELRRRKGSGPLFRFLHSAGALEGGVSRDVDKRRIYVDIAEDVVYSANTQYGGNTMGLKKLALRLSIRKAAKEGWLAEHMFIMGSKGPGGRVTYLLGAFPSACGKTSTAMLPGETIVGDDIAFLRTKDGKLRAANTERGVFGIIRDVNSEGDPLIWNVLTAPGEVIFSNILIVDGTSRWLSDGRPEPTGGVNFSGEWSPGKKDPAAKPIDYSHRNARYTIRLEDLANCDPHLNAPEGVPVGGIIYGGRDSDTNVPVTEAFDWAHGVVTMGAALESETTAATLGKAGVRAQSPMANIDFLAIPLGEYIASHLKAAEGLDPVPKVFASNYFQKDAGGKYLTGMMDKRVWVKWMELRIHGDVGAVETPVGNIPAYDDLARLFKEVLDTDYSRESYEEQFAVRVSENLAKLERAEKLYREEPTTPPELFEIIAAQRARLEEAKAAHGDRISPSAFVA
ncbi:MAG: phosphoenolpyruvate carboxykinase (GTP) [Planctomycetota bacterium]